MTTRAELKTILAEVLDLDESDVSITSANDDGDVKVEFAGLFVDDVDDADSDEEVEDDEEDDDDKVEADANDTSEEE
jgi:hypothetical protein